MLQLKVNNYDSIKANYKRYGTTLRWKDMQEFVDGRIEIVYLSNGDHLIINEEGLLDGLEPNMEATDIWWLDVGLDNVLSHGMPPLVGDIL